MRKDLDEIFYEPAIQSFARRLLAPHSTLARLSSCDKKAV